jgi:hypothetical protein
VAAALDVCQKQRAVMFLCCENETVGNIHRRLKNVYGDDAVNHSTVNWWARRLSGESGRANIQDSPRTGRRQTTQTPDNVQHVNDMVLEDKHVTVEEMSVQLEIGDAGVCRILKQLVLKNVCAWWVLRMLTEAHKETRKLLAQYENGGDDFFARIVMGDEICNILYNK